MSVQELGAYALIALVVVLSAVAFIGMACSIVGMAYNAARVVTNTRPDSAVWKRTFGNPFNAIFITSLLSDEGLQARKRLVVWLKRFVASLAAGVVAYILMNLTA